MVSGEERLGEECWEDRGGICMYGDVGGWCRMLSPLGAWPPLGMGRSD